MTDPLHINSQSDLIRIPPVYKALVEMSKKLDDQVLFPMTRRSKARQEIKELLEQIEGSNLLKQAYLPHNQQQLEELNTQIEEGVATIISKLKEPAQNTFGEMWQEFHIKTPKGYDETQQRTSPLLDLRNPPGPAQTTQPNSLSINSQDDLIRTPPVYEALKEMSKKLDDKFLFPMTKEHKAREKIKELLEQIEGNDLLKQAYLPHNQAEIAELNQLIENGVTEIINGLEGKDRDRFEKIWEASYIKTPKGYDETQQRTSPLLDLRNPPGSAQTTQPNSLSRTNLTQQSSHSTIKSLNEAAKNKLSEAFAPDKSRLLIDLFEGTDPGKAARDIRTALKNEGKHNGLLDDALDNAVDKTLRNMYDKVFEICKEENLVSHSKGGADKGVIDVAGQTLEYQQNPQSKLTRFTIPSEGLSQAVTLRCNKSGAYLTLGPPDGKPIEIVCPKEVEKQCAFDIKHYQEQMSKTSHNTFTAASMDTPNNNLHAPNRGEDKVGATTSFTQHQQEEQPSNGITPTPTPTPEHGHDQQRSRT